MVHIDHAGNLVKIGGSIEDLGMDTSRILISVLFGMMESGEYGEEDLTVWVSSILASAMEVANDEKADNLVKVIRDGCKIALEYEPGMLALFGNGSGKVEAS